MRVQLLSPLPWYNSVGKKLNMNSPTHPFSRPESLWTLVGVLAGIAIGLVIDEAGLGVSIGLLSGLIITMTLERRRKKINHSPLKIGVGVVALIFIVAFGVLKAA